MLASSLGEQNVNPSVIVSTQSKHEQLDFSENTEILLSKAWFMNHLGHHAVDGIGPSEIGYERAKTNEEDTSLRTTLP